MIARTHLVITIQQARGASLASRDHHPPRTSSHPEWGLSHRDNEPRDRHFCYMWPADAMHVQVRKHPRLLRPVFSESLLVRLSAQPSLSIASRHLLPRLFAGIAHINLASSRRRAQFEFRSQELIINVRTKMHNTRITTIKSSVKILVLIVVASGGLIQAQDDTDSQGNRKCVNCINCRGCYGCSNCLNCVDCTVSDNLENCTKCVGCTKLRNCTNCNNIHQCQNRTDDFNMDCAQGLGMNKTDDATSTAATIVPRQSGSINRAQRNKNNVLIRLIKQLDESDTEAARVKL